MPKFITNNPQETFDLGSNISQKLSGGETLVLCGELGAGKTKFLQGLAKGLGVKENINSPTFNILKLYKIPKRKTAPASGLSYFCHIDAYRLASANDLITLGVQEFLDNPECVTAIEWAKKVKALWPKNIKLVKIKLRGEDKREITIN